MNAPLTLPPLTEDQRLETAAPASPAVEEMLNQIAADCQTTPERYLADTVVPFGGE